MLSTMDLMKGTKKEPYRTRNAEDQVVSEGKLKDKRRMRAGAEFRYGAWVFITLSFSFLDKGKL